MGLKTIGVTNWLQKMEQEARSRGVAIRTLKNDGRITRDDVLTFCDKRGLAVQERDNQFMVGVCRQSN